MLCVNGGRVVIDGGKLSVVAVAMLGQEVSIWGLYLWVCGGVQ